MRSLRSSFLFAKTVAFVFVLSSNFLANFEAKAQPKIDQAAIDKLRASVKDRSRIEDALQIPGLRHTHKLPINFPLPIYTSNVVNKGFTNTTQGAPMAQIVLYTKDDIPTVLSWYKAQCTSAGWNVTTPQEKYQTPKMKSGAMFCIRATKGEQQATVSGATTTMFKSKEPLTAISMIWMKHG